MDLNFDYMKIYFDGGSRGNPGPSAVGAVFLDKNDNVVDEISEFIGHCTNNIAEYTALDRVLDFLKKYVQKYNVRRIIINTDSKLLYNQVRKVWKIKDSEIFEIYKKIARKLKDYEIVDLRLIPREENSAADRLVNMALDHGAGQDSFGKSLLDGNNIRFGKIEET
ncbi:MAG: ribonuclease HI family protein [Actinobacteria bacterium]|nr:ribonuclease HI family protein [Actinomycetota bacterium]